jgi:tetratricopeptide (TPR) repeat protein
VADAMGVTFDDFLAGWKAYLAARPLPVGGETELRRLRFRDDPAGASGEWAEIADERARGFARLGEILRERGHWAAARVEYGKAMQRVGPRYTVLVNKFALAALRSGREQEAEALLSQAARNHPSYPALQVSLGRVRVKRKEWKGAREAFLLANRVDPFDPEIHAGLAAAARAEGDEAIASREERFARILAGESPERGHGHPN